MSILEKLKKQMEAKGMNFDNSGRGPKVGGGDFVCKVTDAAYSKGENDNLRGMITLSVVESQKPEEVGGKFKIYISPKTEDYTIKALVEWGSILISNGVPEEKFIEEDEDDRGEKIRSLINAISKFSTKKELMINVHRTPQPIKGDGTQFYWNDISAAFKKEEVEAPVETPKPKSKEKKTPAPAPWNEDED